MQDQSEHFNWVSVINFIQKQYSKNSTREKQWLFEKQNLQQKIHRLEAQLVSNETIQCDLLKRIQLLQIALLQQRSSQNPRDALINPIPKIIENPHLQKKVKLQEHRQFLEKIINDLGIQKKYEDPILEKQNKYFDINKGKLLMKENTEKLSEQVAIIAHLDSIRKVYLNKERTYLASVSQDCLLKIWNYKDLKQQDLQPDKSIRQHTGPLFAMTGAEHPYNPQYSLLFTGGSQGFIKTWSISNNSFGITLQQSISNTRNQNQDHTIWDLQYLNNNLLSSCSDGYVKLYQVKKNNKISLQDKKTYKDNQFNQTSIQWISSSLFLSGCSNAPRATLWDIQGRICQKFLYEIEKNKQPKLYQTNCTTNFKQLKIVALGCEDGQLRLYDYNSAKSIKKLKNNSGISCMSKRLNWQLICGCNDGGLYVWDLRKYALLAQQTKAHLIKYDEGVQSIIIDNKNIITAGTDGLIKLYS